MRVVTVVGARPNLVKAAPILAEFARRGDVESILVHTGQHYDAAMSDIFIRELSLPEPDHHLGVGSASATAQTAAIMQHLEGVLARHRPAAVVVIGDVNSTLAAALTAATMRVPVAHVEAGVRSFDRTMPEELNRVVTDSVADLLLAPTPDACANLEREGAGSRHIRLVGNVLVDALCTVLPAARQRRPWEPHGLSPGGFALVTAHRPRTVDGAGGWEHLLAVLRAAAHRLPVLFPLHPRTARRLAELGLRQELAAIPGLVAMAPAGYLDFIALQDAAAVVLTDSGGVQVETSVLGVPCLTLRTTTEWPVTLTQGTNRLVGNDIDGVATGIEEALARPARRPAAVDLWDGRAAGRIAEAILSPEWTERTREPGTGSLEDHP